MRELECLLGKGGPREIQENQRHGRTKEERNMGCLDSLPGYVMPPQTKMESQFCHRGKGADMGQTPLKCG